MSTLTAIIALPLLAAIVLAFVPRNFRVVMNTVALVATFLSAVLAVKLFIQFNGAPADAQGYKFIGAFPGLGVESLGLACRFGVDGINVGLVLMGAIVAFAAACVSWRE